MLQLALMAKVIEALKAVGARCTAAMASLNAQQPQQLINMQ
jgi:hypothetical protein